MNPTQRRSPGTRGVPFVALAATAIAIAASAEQPQGIPSHGPAAQAAERIQRLFDEAAEITGDADLSATAKRARMEHLLDPLLDNAMLTQAALGPLVERFSREEYGEFSHEYARFVTASLLRRFAAFPGEGSQVEDARYDAERGVAYVVARGAAVKPGYPGVRRLAKLEPVRIELALRRRYGEWRLAGFKRGDVDVARSFREQFAAALDRQEPAELIAELRKRNRKSDEENPFAGGG